jgi:uncharacterized membrane protein YhhN
LDIGSAIFALSLAAILSAIATTLARTLLPRRPGLFYIFKPLTTCLILAVAVLPALRTRSTYGAAIALGLIFSLGGDILLMLPSDRFVAGLTSFLLALLSYGFAFATTTQYSGFPLSAVPIVLVGALILWYLWPALSSALRAPVSVYVLAMVAMTSLAAYRASDVHSAGTLVAAIGAALFLISDAALAIDRFRRPFARSQVVVLGTYFAGQLLIALSVGL